MLSGSSESFSHSRVSQNLDYYTVRKGQSFNSILEEITSTISAVSIIRSIVCSGILAIIGDCLLYMSQDYLYNIEPDFLLILGLI